MNFDFFFIIPKNLHPPRRPAPLKQQFLFPFQQCFSLVQWLYSSMVLVLDRICCRFPLPLPLRHLHGSCHLSSFHLKNLIYFLVDCICGWGAACEEIEEKTRRKKEYHYQEEERHQKFCQFNNKIIIPGTWSTTLKKKLLTAASFSSPASSTWAASLRDGLGCVIASAPRNM